jgi:hypothetical protein
MADRIDLIISESALKRAFEVFANKISEAFSLTHGTSMNIEETARERYAAALALVAHFFRKLRVPYADMFFELAVAIADLNEGILPGLLARSHMKGKREGRPFDSSLLWYARARAALGLHGHLLLDRRSASGTKRRRPNLRRVAQSIAHAHPELEILAGQKRGRSLPSTLINWRNELRRKEKELMGDNQPKNWLAVVAFVEGKNRFESMIGATELRKAADAQIAAAVRFARAMKSAREKKMSS